VDAALLELPMPVRDRLNAAVSRWGRKVVDKIAATLPSGRADGASVLADTLNQVSINDNGRFNQAKPEIIAALREVAVGLRAGRSAPVRAVAVAQLKKMLATPKMIAELEQTMQEVEQTKLANVEEMARVLENEAGSYKDQPIMEAVGHTVLNRMRRNETALVKDVSGRYAHGQNRPSPEARALAIKLLNGQLPDNTSGATHFYQPYAMAHQKLVPKDDNGNYQTENPPKDYEYVPGMTVKDVERKDVPAFSVRPDWADGMRQVPMKGIPDSLAKFFIAPGSRHVR
jgi:hypothetical protein